MNGAARAILQYVIAFLFLFLFLKALPAFLSLRLHIIQQKRFKSAKVGVEVTASEVGTEEIV